MLVENEVTWALSKSFSPFAAVGAAELYGNGTLLVSWFTNRSTRPCPRVLSEMPSGIDSKRKPLGSRSPTVSSGVTCTPCITGESMDGRAVLKPALFWAEAAEAVSATSAAATASSPPSVRRVMSPLPLQTDRTLTRS